jgi:hypothetical protein
MTERKAEITHSTQTDKQIAKNGFDDFLPAVLV